MNDSVETQPEHSYCSTLPLQNYLCSCLRFSVAEQRDDLSEHVWTPCKNLILPAPAPHAVLLRCAAEQGQVMNTLDTDRLAETLCAPKL